MTLVRADTGQDGRADRGSSAAAAAAERPAVRPTVSVVICAYTVDRWEDLKQAVVSVGKETADEIVLVIDHCPELLTRAEFLAQLLPWNIVVAPNRFQQGLAGARNTGVAISQGDIVAFLDDDAAADPGWLAAMADHYQDPRVVGVGGMVRPDWEGGRPSWFPSELDWVVGCCYQGMPTSSVPVRNFIGANMSFRCTVLEDCGGFSSMLGRVGATPLGCEETELCLRIGQRHPDGILLYEPAAAVSHKVPSKRAEWRYLRSRCYAEGLSKAMVARLAGQSRALASERSYVRSTIPRGIWRCLTDAPGGRLSGAMAALTMVIAVAMTTAGYLVGRVTARRARAYPPPADDRPGTAPAGPPAQPAAAPDDTIQFTAAAAPAGPRHHRTPHPTTPSRSSRPLRSPNHRHHRPPHPMTPSSSSRQIRLDAMGGGRRSIGRSLAASARDPGTPGGQHSTTTVRDLSYANRCMRCLTSWRTPCYATGTLSSPALP